MPSKLMNVHKSDISNVTSAEHVQHAHYIEQANNLEPGVLPYLKGRVTKRYSTNPGIPEISRHRAYHLLLDSGATSTFLAERVMTKMLEDVPDYPLEQQSGSITCATSSATQILYRIKVFFHVQDVDGAFVHIPFQAYVVKELRQDIILGWNFVSRARQFTPRHLNWLTANTVFNMFDIEYFQLPVFNVKNFTPTVNTCVDSISPSQVSSDSKVVQSKYDSSLNNRSTSHFDSPHVVAIVEKTTIIWPSKSSSIPISIENKHKWHSVLFSPYRKTKSHFPGLTIKSTVLYPSKKDVVFVPIQNDSKHAWILEKGRQIGHLSFRRIPPRHVHFSDPLAINLNYVELEPTIQAENFINKQLSQDTSLTDSERVEQKDKFLEEGYCEISASDLLTKCPTNEMFPPDDAPLKTPEQCVNEVDLSHLPTHWQEYIRKQLHTVSSVFSRAEWDVQKVKTPIIPHVEPTAALKNPVSAKYYPISLHLRDKVQQSLDSMERCGIIRRVKSGSTMIINNLHAVLKRDAKQSIRIICDTRLSNFYTKRLKAAMPPIESMLQKMGESKVFTTLDLSNAFYQCEISKQSQNYFGFYSPESILYTFCRLPQGFHSSMQWIAIILNDIFKHLPQATAYADDIIITNYKGDIKAYIDSVITVLKTVADHKMKIKPQKLHFCITSGVFFGIAIDMGRFSIPKSRCQAIMDTPEPHTYKQLRSFLYTAGWFRKFIPDFAEITAPMFDMLTNKKGPLTLTPEARHSFGLLKKLMCRTVTLSVPDENKPYIIQTDASERQLASVLMQQDDDGTFVFIHCNSRRLSKSEREGWHIYKKEACAMSTALIAYSWWILGSPFPVKMFCDARSLLFIKYTKSTSPIVMRFAQTISYYNCELFHVAGKDNIITDYFTRNMPENRVPSNDMKTQEAEIVLDHIHMPDGTHFRPELIQKLLNDPGMESLIQKSKPKASSKAQLKASEIMPKLKHDRKVKMPAMKKQRYNNCSLSVHNFELVSEEKQLLPAEPLISQLLSSCPLLSNSRSCPVFSIQCNAIAAVVETAETPHIHVQTLKHANTLLVDGHLSLAEFKEAQQIDSKLQTLFTKPPKNYKIKEGILFHADNQGTLKPVLPENLLKVLFFALHHDVISGAHRSPAQIRNAISAHFFLSNADQLIRDYVAKCFYCLKNKTDNLRKHALQKLDVAQHPRQHWYMDICVSLPPSDRFTDCLVLVDSFSLFVCLIPLRSREKSECSRALRELIMHQTVPQKISTDSESGFQANVIFDLCEQYGIELINTAPYSPQSNSLAEVKVHMTKNLLRPWCAQTKQQWPNKLPTLLSALNKTPSVHGPSAEELHYGSQSSDSWLPVRSVHPVTTMSQYANLVKRNLAKASKEFSEQRTERNRVMREKRNRSRGIYEFSPGDIVALKSHKIATSGTRSGALKEVYTAPYAIDAMDSQGGTTCTLRNLNTDKCVRAHITHLRPIKSFPTHIHVKANWDEAIAKFTARQQQ